MWGPPSITFVNASVVGVDGLLADSIRVHGGLVDRLGGGPDRGDIVIDLDGRSSLRALSTRTIISSSTRFRDSSGVPATSTCASGSPIFSRALPPTGSLAAARPETLADRVWVGGLKNVLSGVTTVCHHNPLHRPLRSRFPVRVVRRFGMSHSLQIDGARVAAAYRDTPPNWPWIIHAAEGVDEEAEREVGTAGRDGMPRSEYRAGPRRRHHARDAESRAREGRIARMVPDVEPLSLRQHGSGRPLRP